MSRLRLPDLRGLVPAAPPPALPTATRAVAVPVTRRQFLAALCAAGVVATVPLQRVERAWAARRGRFFTRTERRTLGALADTILPPDADPGATALGVVDYVEQLLTAFDHRVPALYAGGPFSGRNPFIDHDRGVPSRRRPKNAFRKFVPPTRLQALRFRQELFGTAGLDAASQALVAPLDAQLGGPLRGLRDVYREGLAAVDALALETEGATLASLDAAARARVRAKAAQTLPLDVRRGRNFVGVVVQHVIEGALSAPEYGGNRRGAGWAMLGLEGDSQPLGYALYARRDDAYHERADHPLSTPNPDEVDAARPISADATLIQTTIVATTGGLPEGC